MKVLLAILTHLLYLNFKDWINLIWFYFKNKLNWLSTSNIEIMNSSYPQQRKKRDEDSFERAKRKLTLMKLSSKSKLGIT